MPEGSFNNRWRGTQRVPSGNVSGPKGPANPMERALRGPVARFQARRTPAHDCFSHHRMFCFSYFILFTLPLSCPLQYFWQRDGGPFGLQEGGGAWPLCTDYFAFFDSPGEGAGRYDLWARLTPNWARVSRQYERATLHEKPMVPSFNPRPCAAFHNIKRIGGP